MGVQAKRISIFRRTCGEGTEKLHQEKGSKKRFSSQQTEDVVSNLHTDKPTSEYDSPSPKQYQQQQHYEDILLQQHDNFPAKYDINIKFPETDILCSADALDDSYSSPAPAGLLLSCEEGLTPNDVISTSVDTNVGAADFDTLLLGSDISTISTSQQDAIRNDNATPSATRYPTASSPASLSGALLNIALSVAEEESGYKSLEQENNDLHLC